MTTVNAPFGASISEWMAHWTGQEPWIHNHPDARRCLTHPVQYQAASRYLACLPTSNSGISHLLSGGSQIRSLFFSPTLPSLPPCSLSRPSPFAPRIAPYSRTVVTRTSPPPFITRDNAAVRFISPSDPVVAINCSRPRRATSSASHQLSSTLCHPATSHFDDYGAKVVVAHGCLYPLCPVAPPTMAGF